jgi:hypothetical protein
MGRKSSIPVRSFGRSTDPARGARVGSMGGPMPAGVVLLNGVLVNGVLVNLVLAARGLRA